jgi:hypothetical protein
LRHAVELIRVLENDATFRTGVFFNTYLIRIHLLCLGGAVIHPPGEADHQTGTVAKQYRYTGPDAYNGNNVCRLAPVFCYWQFDMMQCHARV